MNVRRQRKREMNDKPQKKMSRMKSVGSSMRGEKKKIVLFFQIINKKKMIVFGSHKFVWTIMFSVLRSLVIFETFTEKKKSKYLTSPS